LDTNYTYLNRVIGSADLPTGATLSSALVLPTGLPKNKLIGTGTFRFPHQILGLVSMRYEGGVTLQDTSYASTSALYLPYGSSLASVDLAAVVPVRTKFSVQAGARNLLDRNYFYTAGYPEEGRNWFVNLLNSTAWLRRSGVAQVLCDFRFKARPPDCALNHFL
jgi:iron complex outermembrane receptor protein